MSTRPGRRHWILLRAGEPALDRGGGGLDHAGSPRKAYIASLRAADCADYSPLLQLFGGNGTRA